MHFADDTIDPFPFEGLDSRHEPDTIEVTLGLPDLGLGDAFIYGEEHKVFYEIISLLRQRCGLKFTHLSNDGTYSVSGPCTPAVFQSILAFFEEIKDHHLFGKISFATQILPNRNYSRDGNPLLIQIDGAPLTRKQVAEVLDFVDEFGLDTVSVHGTFNGRPSALTAIGDTDLREATNDLLNSADSSFLGITLCAPAGFSPVEHGFLKTLSQWLHLQGASVSTTPHRVLEPLKSETDSE